MERVFRYTVENFLGLFYIRNVTATYRAPLEPRPHYVEMSLPLLLSLGAVEMLVTWLQARDSWRLADTITNLVQTVLREVVRFSLLGVHTLIYVYVWKHWRWFDIPWNTPASFWFTMLAVDFGYYCLHRASHEVNIIWASHQVHHSSEFFNLGTNFRQPAGQQYFNLMFYLPLALIGVAPSMYGTHFEFNLIYQTWIHTEMVKSIGPLEHILNTPSHHRVHHGSNVKYLDKNYAGVLIIWDRLFGTFCWEEETPTYGLVHNIESYDMWTIQLAHFRWIWQDVQQQVGIKNKLKRIFYGPGWVPGTGRLGDPSTFPEPDPGRVKFDRQTSNWRKVYVTLHTIVLLVMAVDFIRHHASLSVFTGLVYGVMLTYTISCVGWLLDGSRWAAPAELIRCCLSLLSLSYISWLPAALLSAIRPLFVGSALIWLPVGWDNFRASKLVRAKVD